MLGIKSLMFYFSAIKKAGLFKTSGFKYMKKLRLSISPPASFF
ncbi:xylose isomerase [Mucilaginibacter xinganensis]|uniref:Xylose isomerase n=1 Tax=Mucilaginibacter xinganensis TaxID=1234841 RepID=A0A223NXT8_9SPHI|nr:xylose isomerase [Mucilaginibacter xinganensis]